MNPATFLGRSRARPFNKAGVHTLISAGGLSSSLSALLIATLLAWLAPSAHAQINYTFHQAGFSGGGEINGTFTAVDLDSDHLIFAAPWGDSLTGYEVTSFFLSFTGDKFVADFSTTNLGALGYEPDNGNVLGDSPSEGLANNWFGDGVMYTAGLGPLGSPGGLIIDLSTGDQSSTDDSLIVSIDSGGGTGAVPEPSTYGLIVAVGLLVQSGYRRYRRRTLVAPPLVSTNQ